MLQRWYKWTTGFTASCTYHPSRISDDGSESGSWKCRLWTGSRSGIFRRSYPANQRQSSMAGIDQQYGTPTPGGLLYLLLLDSFWGTYLRLWRKMKFASSLSLLTGNSLSTLIGLQRLIACKSTREKSHGPCVPCTHQSDQHHSRTFPRLGGDTCLFDLLVSFLSPRRSTRNNCLKFKITQKLNSIVH